MSISDDSPAAILFDEAGNPLAKPPGTPAASAVAVQGVPGGVPIPVIATIAMTSVDQGAPNSDANSWPVHQVGALPLAANAAQEAGGHLASIDAKIPASPSQEHATAGSPSAARLSDGAAFYKATTPADTQPAEGTGTPGAPAGGVMTIQGDPAGTPIPITGTIMAPNPSVGADGAAAPGFSTQIGGQDAGGLLQPTAALAAAPVGTEVGLITRNIPSGTQPISAASLPLPAGAATEATSAAILADTADIEASTANLDVALSTRASEATLASILSQLDVALSTRASQATLVSILVQLDVALSTRASEATLATRASEATLALIKAKTDNLDVLLSSRASQATLASVLAQLDVALSTRAAASTQTDGTQKSIVRGGTKGATVPADVTSTSVDADHQALDVAIKAGSLTVTEASVGVNGAAAPGSSNQAGFQDAVGNLEAARVHDLDTGVGAEFNVGVSLRKSAGGGSVELGTPADPVRVDPTGTTTQPVSAASLPLPVGAATAANQTNGAQQTQIVQGGNTAAVTGASALKVDGSAVTQPISAASLPLPTGASTEATLAAVLADTADIETSVASLDVLLSTRAAAATQTDGTQKAIARGGAKGATVPADLTGTAEGADHQALDVQIYSGGVAKDPTAIRALTSADVVTANQGTANATPWNENVAQWGGAATTLGQKAMAASVPVAIASDQGAVPVTGPLTQVQLEAELDEKLGDLGQKTSAGSAPVVIASDQSTIPVSFAGTHDVNVAQVAGTAAAVNAGTVNAGTQRVVLASDQPTVAVSDAALELAQGSTTSGQKGPLAQGAVTTAAPAYTTGQTDPLSLTTAGALRVDGSATTQPVSGTVTANLGTTAGLVTDANLDEKFGDLGQKAMAGSAPVVIASDQSAVPVSGTVTANIGTTNGLALDASVTGLQVAQGSATSGEKGPLVQGAVTTAAPAYTTAQTSPLSLTTAGALRTDSSAVTQPISAASLPLPAGAATSANQTTLGNQTTKINDGTNTAAVKAASTAPVVADPALVVAISPNTPTLSTTNGSVGTDGSAVPASVTVIGGEDNAGNVERLNLTAAGALIVDGSAVTQPVSGTVTANQGTAAATAGAWPTKLTDGTNVAAVKAASTAAAAADPAAVVSLSPNSPLPAGTNVIGALSANQSVNLNQVAGSAVTTQAAGELLVGVEGRAATGAAVTGNPVLSGGSDGANARSLLTDSSGRQLVVGAAAQGAAVAGNPVLVCGEDAGGNAQRLETTALPPVGSKPGLVTRKVAAQTGTVTSVASSATNVTLLAANTARLGAVISNDSTKNLFVKLGATASATSYTYLLLSGERVSVDAGYTGQIDGIWSAANGNSRITELT